MADPTLPDVKSYLGATAATYDESVIEAALVAETAAQAKVCRVGEGDLPADLAEALLRRVARNLAMRRIPLGVQQSEVGGTAIGTNDPELRRLERPYRKITVG